MQLILIFQAVKDYRTALEKDEDLQRAKEGLARAQKLEKQASKRDYYKILGVKRSATKKDINKVGFAFRSYTINDIYKVIWSVCVCMSF